MAKRKKRNAITLVSLLLILMALLVVYVWYTNKSADTSKVEAEKNISLAVLDTKQLAKLHYIGSDVDITLALEEGVWKSVEDKERPINQDKVQSLIDVINEVNATRIISDTSEHLADYGLDNPTVYLQVEQKDGTTVTLQIGDEIPGGGSFYGLVGEDGKVYLLDSSYGTGLKLSQTDITAVEDGPEITSANISHISITNSDGQDLEVKATGDITSDSSATNSNQWFILKPYGEAITADNSKISEFTSKYTTFDFVSCVDYKGEDLSLYGLNNPIATIQISYYETSKQTLEEPEKDPQTGEETTEKTVYTAKEFGLVIGNEDGSGNRYVMKQGSNAVYTMSTSSLDTMLNADAFSLINPYVCAPSIDTIDKIDAVIGGKTYTMEIKRTTQKNEDGEEETKATYFYQGSEVKEESFMQAYYKIIALKYDAEIKKDADISGSEPYLTLTFYGTGTDGNSFTASYLPYDDSFDTVVTDSGVFFFADKRTVEAAAEAILAIK